MKKKIYIIVILIITIFPINIKALEYPELHYNNAIIYDLTDKKTLYEVKSEEKVSIASLTKLMTIIIAIENNPDLNKKIIYDQKMSNNVAWYASKAGFRVGDELTIYDLLYGAMLPSGADATVALAITTSGSLEDFIILMNKKAAEIGMTNSNFVNVHGLDEENHYSTAKDIKILLEYALQNEEFKKIYTTKEYTLSTGKIIKSTVERQKNYLNLDLSKILGSKTGTTGNAGLCISVLMKHQNHEIIIITLGAPILDGNNPYNVIDATKLISFIEENYSNQTLTKKNDLIKTIKVENSKINNYKIKVGNNLSLFLENSFNIEDFEVKYTGINKLSYKNTKGQKLGTIKYYYKNKEIFSEDIFLNVKIEPDYLKILNNNKKKILLISLIIIILVSTTTILIKRVK